MKKIVHICPLDRNTGDNALNKAIRTMLGQAFAIEHLELVGTQFDRAVFDKLNAADAVVFGGGGVVHSCSGGNSRKNREHTGTMWNMDLDWIAELKSKIILYSVGFNRFQGEPPPLTRMGEFYDVLSRKGALASFRNDLSRERFLEYFPRFGGVKVTPDPGLFCRGTLREGSQSYALLQIACDRLEYRYPNGLNDFLQLLNAMREVSPVPIFLIPHTTADRRIYGKLTATLNADNILGDITRYVDVDDAMDLYRNALYTISTRGHSQICSIGNGTPTFAMSTHPKARGFMEEVGQLDACFDYLNSDRNECLDQFQKFLARLPKIRDQLIDSNRRFDAEIDEFNKDIYRYVYEDWTPPPLLTDPDAVPKQQAARLEDEIGQQAEAARQPALASAAAVRADTKNAYLPGRVRKVGVGTFVKGEPVAAKGALLPPPARKSATSLLTRTQRSSDGATCGVVISCDANYFVGVGTCIAALRRYNPQLPITFLDAGLRPDQVEHAKVLADTYAPIPELETLDVSTFPSHLSKAALSSLYCHLADYDKVLYLDVDALVLGDLSPMFEALDAQTDIVGIRGNYFNRLNEGRRHVTRSEVADEGIQPLAAAFPVLDLDAPGINSGCFVVWSRTSVNWQETYHELLPFMEYFRTADQALLNALISIDGLSLKLFDPMYNCMGFQLTKVRHQVQELTTGIDIDYDQCSLTLAGKRVVVAHFAGRRKPWDTSLNLAPSFAWDWHAATTEAERKWVVAKHRVCRENNDAAVLKAALAEMEVSEDPFQFCLDMGDFLRLDPDRVAVANRLFELAAEKRKKSFGALKNQILLGPQLGRFAPSVDLYRSDKKFSDNRDQRLKAFAATEIPALDGRFSSEGGANTPADVSHLRVREYARINKPNLMEAVIASLSLQRQLNPEMVLLRSFATHYDLQASAVETMGYFARNDGLRRRASNAALRTAAARLGAMQDFGKAIEGLPAGPVAQLGAGFGYFLRGLSHVLGRPGVSIDVGGPVCPESGGLARLNFEDVGTDMSLLVVANMIDRASDPRSVIGGFAGMLQRDGYLLLIDPINKATGLDLFEGLGFIVPGSKVPKTEQVTNNTGFVLERSWLVDGERLLLLRKLSGRRPAGAKAKLTDMLTQHATILRDAAHSVENATEATAQVVRERLARIVFQADTVLGKPLPIDRRKKRVLQSVPVLPPPSLPDAGPAVAKVLRDTNYVHIAYWSSQNAGDRVLCEQTAEVLAEAFPGRSSARVNLSAAEPYEKHLDGRPPAFFVLGGGGIFHSTSSENGVCEWNIDRDGLEALESPIVGFGIGLNEFRGSDFYGTPLFRDYVGAMLKKSVFFGVREKQSVAMLRKMFPEYSSRIFYQPCASLLLRFRYPVLQLDRSHARNAATHVVISPAFDRSHMRFGNRMDVALLQLQGLADHLLSLGHRVSIFAHCPEDAYLHSVMARRNEIGLVRLTEVETKDVIGLYSDVDLAISMRTHGLLVPFAMGIPTMALETHDKLIRSNEDLGILSWGVDLFDTEFGAKSSRIAAELLDNKLAAQSLIKSRLNAVYQVTQANIQEIKARIQGLSA